MRYATCVMLLFLAACSSTPAVSSDVDRELFAPQEIKLDSFSKLRAFSGGANPDGLEAVVEFDDRFGDRTKAAGNIYFELFTYRQGWPNPAGDRIASPWSSSLLSYDQQKTHWERASGAYDFRLACDGLEWDKPYVLSATFEPVNGKRMTATILIPADTTHGKATPADDTSASQPSQRPGARYPQP